MNVHPLHPGLPEATRRALAALPQFEPSPALAERVLARARPRRAWPLADLMARSRSLEGELAARRDGPPCTVCLVAELELARVDAALQEAYERGATREELDRLWRSRTVTLESLVNAYQRPDAVVHI